MIEQSQNPTLPIHGVSRSVFVEAYYAQQRKEFDEARALFYKKYRGEIPAEKLEIRGESHTHFTMKKNGVLTGSCSYGVEQFMRDKEFNKDISIREIDKVIGDSYGSKEFREFFKF